MSEEWHKQVDKTTHTMRVQASATCQEEERTMERSAVKLGRKAQRPESRSLEWSDCLEEI